VYGTPYRERGGINLKSSRRITKGDRNKLGESQARREGASSRGMNTSPENQEKGSSGKWKKRQRSKSLSSYKAHAKREKNSETTKKENITAVPQLVVGGGGQQRKD